jgi:serine protease Do
VKAAFQEVLAGASAATVSILADGDQVALGAVVDSGGYIVTKASVLYGTITCRFADGSAKEARLVGSNANHDLALLRVEAANLPAIKWRDGPLPLPGAMVATSGSGMEPVAVGVVGSDLRQISGPATPTRPQGWLGMQLRDGDSGAEVESVSPRSPAARAGIRAGDEVKQFNGAAMESAEQVVAAVRACVPKQAVKLLVRRDDKDVELTATLAKSQPPQGPQDHWGGGPFSERRTGFPVVLPHDTPLHPRDCGGPLVDTDGRAVGINIARALRVTTYALPANLVRQTVEELKRKAVAPWPAGRKSS